MAGDHDFPVLFTIEGSNRHEVILLNPGLDLAEVKAAVEAMAQSPNCAEVLSKYRSKERIDSVSEVKVKWAAQDKLFPKETLLTEENVEAVLLMVAKGNGRDVLDVKVVQKSEASNK